MERGSKPQSSETDSPTDSPEKPQAPAASPAYAVKPLAAQDPGLLREIGEYCLALADWKADQQRVVDDEEEGDDPLETPDEWDDEDWEDEIEDAYDDLEVPPGVGGIYVNMIDGRGYYYLKGSYNGEFFSEYVAPVSPKQRGSSD